ncbi:hypothetical protein Peur_002907 [Populus x canadensis]
MEGAKEQVEASHHSSRVQSRRSKIWLLPRAIRASDNTPGINCVDRIATPSSSKNSTTAILRFGKQTVVVIRKKRPWLFSNNNSKRIVTKEEEDILILQFNCSLLDSKPCSLCVA